MDAHGDNIATAQLAVVHKTEVSEEAAGSDLQIFKALTKFVKL